MNINFTKNLLLVATITLAAAIGFIVYQRHFAPINQQIFPPTTIPLPDYDYSNIVMEVNQKNALIQSVSYTDVAVDMKNGIVDLKLNAKIEYQKPFNLNMNVKSFLGDELVMGSNNDEFWFWSKRMQPSALHYAKHIDLNKTRLKPAFSPMIIMDSFGLAPLSPNAAYAPGAKENRIVAMTEERDTLDRPVMKMVFIDTHFKRVVGQMLTDKVGKLIASSEILSWNGDIPTQILYHWFEEDKVMLMTMNHFKINEPIDGISWQKPKMENSIDMSKD